MKNILPNKMSYDSSSMSNFEAYTMDKINELITYLAELTEVMEAQTRGIDISDKTNTNDPHK